MTEKEILKVILLNAYSKGFKLKVFPKPDKNGWIPTYTAHELVKHIENGSLYLKDFLFDIVFAKCFFGTEKMFCDCCVKENEQIREWEFNLKNLAVLDDKERLKYLERYLNESKN